MEEKEQADEQGFRVVDRRRFADTTDVGTSEGDASTSEVSPVADESEVKAQDDSAQKHDAKSEASKERRESAKPSTSTKGGEEETPKVDFSSFVVGMAHQALVMLGQAPHPDSNSPILNLPAARQTIDILSMLEDKTAGNLSEEEDSLLKNIVSSLQIAYVDVASGKKS